MCRSLRRAFTVWEGRVAPGTQALVACGRYVITYVFTQEAAMVKLTVRKVGNSLGVTLPAKAAQALHVK